MRMCSGKLGFSLVELMVTISIIAVLTTLGMGTGKMMKLKAIRANLATNLNAARTLVVTWEAASESGPNLTNPAICPADQQWTVPGAGYDAGWRACTISYKLGSTDCLGTNPYGFKFTNCTSPYSTYLYMVQSPTSLRHWTIVAANPALDGICPSTGISAEVITINRCARKCGVFRITSLAPCTTSYVFDVDCPGGPVTTNFANCEN